MLIFISGCVTIGGGWGTSVNIETPRDFQHLVTKEAFFLDPKDLEKYKIIFQSNSLNPHEGLLPLKIFEYSKEKRNVPKDKRIDIFVSNINGSVKKNLTEHLHRNQVAYFLFPSWSPDYSKLAFVAYSNIRIKEISRTWHRIYYTLEGYVAEEDTLMIRKVVSIPKEYSILSGKLNTETGNQLRLIEPRWSKDGKQILIDRRIVSIENDNHTIDLSYEEYKEMENEFAKKWSCEVNIRKYYPFISPNSKYEMRNAGYRKKSRLRIPVYDIPMMMSGGGWSLKPITDLYIPTVYLKKHSEAIMICEGFFDDFQWSTDSNYVLCYNISQKEFYVINSKGKSISLNGCYPTIR